MASTKRRQYGTGSIYKRNSDGRWFGQIQAGWLPSGARRIITVSAATEAEAKRRLKKKQDDIARDGLPNGDVSGRVTIKAWAEVWLAERSRKLRPKAYATTASAVRTWVIPTIGHRHLADITPGDVRAVTAAMRKAGRKPSSALRMHVDLMQLLRAAMLDGHAVPPRVLLVDRPGVNPNDRLAMEVPQAVAVLDFAARELPHASRWVAALLQGMRRGEALGLTWARVDLVNGVMDISWQLQELPYLDKSDRGKGFRVPDDYECRQLEGRLHLTRPKTSAGQRIIPLVPWMTSALTQWRAIAPKSPHDLVWPGMDGGPASMTDDLEEWKALQETCDVRHPSGRYYVGHETRHTTATLLLEAGVDPEVIKQIMGHSSIIAGEAYKHAPAHMAASALGQIAERLQLGAGAL